MEISEILRFFHQDKGKIQFQKSPSFSAHLIDNK